MSSWEEIIRDRLERREIALPEGSLAGFRARLDGSGQTPAARRFPFAWVMTAVAFVGLAVFLILRNPDVQEEVVPLVQQPPVNLVPQKDLPESEPPVSTAPLIAQTSSSGNETGHLVNDSLQEKEDVHGRESEAAATPETADAKDTPGKPASGLTFPTDISQIHPQPAGGQTVSIKKNNTGIIVAGGGLLAAFATQLANATPPPINPFYRLNDGGLRSHQMPLILGLSVKVPVTEKLGITTGLEYSLYASGSALETQRVHYLGIPVRLDWTFASGNWFEAYAGAGVKGDLCIGATFAGEPYGRDGPAFRLLGACGVQWNVTGHLGIYVEPEISWTLPSERRILSTYSSEHPWMFSVAAGLRVNLNK